MGLEPIRFNISFESFVSTNKSFLWPHNRIYQDTDIGDILYVTECYKDIDNYIWNNSQTLFCLDVE